MSWNDLQHKFWQVLQRAEGFPMEPILVGLSGGLDSVVLLNLLIKCWVRTPDRASLIKVLHFHHGAASLSQIDFRDRAQVLCKKISDESGFEFLTETASKNLASEADFRKARYSFFAQALGRFKSRVMVLGHHADDLLETRLLRMLRGVGTQGFVAMSEWSQFPEVLNQAQIFRPLLTFSKSELRAYAFEKNLEFLEDPSNLDSDSGLRSWIRNTWLPDLESKVPGARTRLGHSFEILAHDCARLTDSPIDLPDSLFKVDFGDNVFDTVSMSRPVFMSLTKKEKSRALAKYLLKLKKLDFSQGQIEEIIKRLDNLKNDFIFKVSGLNWQVSDLWIRANLEPVYTNFD